MCRSVANANSLRSDSGLQLIDRANDFLDAGFIRPALSDLFLLLPEKWTTYI
ncbi:hypothetical protein D3C72_668210 [compost metagenome]